MQQPYRFASRLWNLCLALALAGCAGISHKPQSGVAPPIESARHIAIFFDGTANDEGSDTNVKKLHSLVTLQDRPDIASLYIQGVGIGTDLSGAAAGSGINRRVQIAYEFIHNHYRHKASGERDKIYIFGFSRGAYSARILTSLLYNAGLPQPEDRAKCRLTSDELAEVVHEAVAPQSAHVDRIVETQRRQRSQNELHLFNTDPVKLPAARGCFRLPSQAVDVEVLGLWDTVEALGVPNWPSRIAHKLAIEQHIENIDVRNVRYGDKLCNVHHAFHAASIDDNRAWIFTPLLLTRKHQFDACEKVDDKPQSPMLDKKTGQIIQNRLQEVWFAGAHSDVGGGYGDSALSGVSLNWMIRALNHAAGGVANGILPPGAKVREDPFGTSHDPSTGFFDVTYHAMYRNLYRYMEPEPKPVGTEAKPAPEGVFKGHVCVHRSVFERRARVARQPFDNPQLDLLHSGVAWLSPVRIDSTPRWMWPVQHPKDPSAGQASLAVDQYPTCQNIDMPQEPTT